MLLYYVLLRYVILYYIEQALFHTFITRIGKCTLCLYLLTCTESPSVCIFITAMYGESVC